ncbi:MAG: hypothetical protein J1F66_00775 [Clostridiales bacterium]|nr:hypothetical protein [Clostridiales bacterium]
METLPRITQKDSAAFLKPTIDSAVSKRRLWKKSDKCENWHCCSIPRRRRAYIAVHSIPKIYQKIAIVEEILHEDEIIAKLRNE